MNRVMRSPELLATMQEHRKTIYSIDLIIPERQRTAHWDGYRRVMTSGVTRYGDDILRVPALHADGQRRSIAFTVSLLKGSDGECRASLPSCGTRPSDRPKNKNSAAG